MNLKDISFWANRFQEFHFGQFVIAKFWWLLSVVNALIIISIKWEFDPVDYIVPLVLFVVLFTWITGRILEKRGFRKHFQDAQFKNVKLGG